MASVFEFIRPYGYVHHRALNSVSKLEASLTYVRRFPQVRHVFEGDVSWNFERGVEELYFRHPSFVFDSLSRNQIAHARSAGELVAVEDTLKLVPPDVALVIELKVGRGDTDQAMKKLISILKKSHGDRFWIDGFSLKLLQKVKEIDSTVQTTLHTELVTSGRVLIGAPEWPVVRWKKLTSLQGVDGIAIRKAFSDEFMKSACDSVRTAGLLLTLSRLNQMSDYIKSKEWGAVAGYPKSPFEEVMAREGHAPVV